MAGGSDSDPYERYFRPRPGTSDADREDLEGVSIEEAQPLRVTIAPRSRASGPHARPRTRTRPRLRLRTRRAGSRSGRAFTVAGIMSLIVLAASGGAWAFQDYVLGRIQRIDAFGGLDNRPDGGPKGAMNILVAGVDRRDGLTPEQIRQLRLGRFEGERSDTMMLVHLSADHDKATVVSLPRDSLVTIPEHRSNGAEGPHGTLVPAKPGKLNWAYMYGGPSLTISAIEGASGVRVDHYVEVNFLGFLKMVDALGGVDICTPEAIDDPKSGLRLAPGKHHVDGPTALAYARTRYSLTGGSDLGRIDRQQQFMAALLHQALSTSTLSDPVKFSQFLGATLEVVRADEGLSRDAITALAAQLKDMSTDSVAFTTVPLANANHMTSIGGTRQSTVRWHKQTATALFQKIKNDQPIIEPGASPTPPRSTAGPGALTVTPRRIHVRVLNGVGTPGLAARAAADLKRAGFRIAGAPGNAERRPARTTVIQYGPDREDSARTLQAAVPGAKLRMVRSLGPGIQVIVGSSWSGAKRVKVAAVAGGESSRPKVRTAAQSTCEQA